MATVSVKGYTLSFMFVRHTHGHHPMDIDGCIIISLFSGKIILCHSFPLTCVYLIYCFHMSMSMSTLFHMYAYVYVYVCVCVCLYVCLILCAMAT